MKYEVIEYNEELPIKILLKSIIEYPFHWHDAIEIIFVLKGSVNVDIGAERHLLNEQDILVVNINQAHRIYNTNEANVILILQIDPKFCAKYYPNIKNLIFYCNSTKMNQKDKNAFQTLRHNLIKIIYEFNEKTEGYDLRIKNILRPLLFNLINSFDYLRLEESDLKYDEVQFERLQRLMNYIYENYMHKISLYDIADREHLSMYYLSHLIKQKSGLSFQELLNFIRVEESLKLLLSTDKTISEISLDCGFSAPRYYNKHFKRYYECSPLEYRKKYKMRDNNLNEKQKFGDFDMDKIMDKLKCYLDDNRYKYLYSYISKMKKFQVDLTAEGQPFMHNWDRFIIIDDAKEYLRSDYQLYLKNIQEEIGFEYVKIYGILHKQMQIYEDGDKQEIYYWHNVDNIISFVKNLNLKLIINLDPMPISSARAFNIIKEFLVHYANLYGEEEINSWIFKVSNNEDDEFYDQVHKVITSRYPKIKVLRDKKYGDNIDFLYDTAFMSAYIINTIIKHNEAVEFVKAVDSVNLNSNKSNSVFYGDSGLITTNGLKKASYYGYHLLSCLGNELIQQEDDYIVTRNGDNIQILLFNYIDINNNKNNIEEENVDTYFLLKLKEYKNIIINLKNLAGDYKITRYKLNHNQGSVFGQWVAMGEPKYLSLKDENLLKKVVFPYVSFNYVKKSSSKNLKVKLPPYGSELILLEKVNKK